MTITQHAVASGIVSAYFFSVSRSWVGTLFCFLSGIFVDLDHLADYIWCKKKMCWSLSKLEHFCFNKREKNVYLVMHSYELMVVFWILAFVWFKNFVWMGLVFGATVHLLLDQAFNDVYPYAYFMIYRARLGFPMKVFFREDFIKELIDKKK